MIGCRRVADPGFRDQRDTVTASFIVLARTRVLLCEFPHKRVGSETSERHCHLIRTVTRAGFAHRVDVGGMATAVKMIGVETVVRNGGDHHAVAVSVDIRRTRFAPGEVHRVPTLCCSHTH